MVSSEPTWHVSRVQKRVSKFVNFKVQKVQIGPFYALPKHTPEPPVTQWEALHWPFSWGLTFKNDGCEARGVDLTYCLTSRLVSFCLWLSYFDWHSTTDPLLTFYQPTTIDLPTTLVLDIFFSFFSLIPKSFSKLIPELWLWKKNH